jgi:hypothetical protein
VASDIDTTLCAIFFKRSSPVKEKGEALTGGPAKLKAKGFEVNSSKNGVALAQEVRLPEFSAPEKWANL